MRNHILNNSDVTALFQKIMFKRILKTLKSYYLDQKTRRAKYTFANSVI